MKSPAPADLTFLLLVAIILALAGPASAVEFIDVKIAGKPALVCRVKVKEEKLQLFLRDDRGQSLKSFEGVERWLATRGQKLLFGMNGGMYHANLAPVGLYIENGRQLSPLNLGNHYGNFFLKPNGVFCITASGAHVVEASAFARITEPVTLATQSGPMLVVNGRLHPAFRQGSDSRLARNGVGVATPDIALFVICTEPINFHDFATFFRDDLHCPNALFLDGTVSSLFAPPLKRSDKLIDLGPILGVAGQL